MVISPRIQVNFGFGMEPSGIMWVLSEGLLVPKDLQEKLVKLGPLARQVLLGLPEPLELLAPRAPQEPQVQLLVQLVQRGKLVLQEKLAQLVRQELPELLDKQELLEQRVKQGPRERLDKPELQELQEQLARLEPQEQLVLQDKLVQLARLEPQGQLVLQDQLELRVAEISTLVQQLLLEPNLETDGSTLVKESSIPFIMMAAVVNGLHSILEQ